MGPTGLAVQWCYPLSALIHSIKTQIAERSISGFEIIVNSSMHATKTSGRPAANCGGNWGWTVGLSYTHKVILSGQHADSN